MADISQLAKIGGVDAQRTATELFGMAVDNFSTGTINPALRAAFGQAEEPPVNRNDGSWYSTSYAASLANSQFRPKFKFMFRVEFLFKPTVLEQFAATTAAWKNNFVFSIRSVDRPKIDFEYEDVNQYNFRTKVLKSIKHQDLTMTFTDDVGNNVHEFFRFMMMVHQPITRRSVGASQNISDAFATYANGNGMLFSDNLGNVNDYAHRGVLNSDVGNAIQAIKVTQMYVTLGRGQSDLDNGAKEVSFFFINPRIVSLDLDDVNHELSDPNLFTMKFDYDYMVMSDQQIMKKPAPEKSLPPVGSAPSEPTPTGRGAGGTNTSPAGNNNPYTQILAGVAGRAVQRITSETIGRKIRQIPGAGSVADTLGGLVAGVTAGSINGLGTSVNQSFARPGRDVVTDGSTAGRDTAKYTTSTGGFGPDQPGVGTPQAGA
jgi:hypothetical protein